MIPILTANCIDKNKTGNNNKTVQGLKFFGATLNVAVINGVIFGGIGYLFTSLSFGYAFAASVPFSIIAILIACTVRGIFDCKSTEETKSKTLFYLPAKSIGDKIRDVCYDLAFFYTPAGWLLGGVGSLLDKVTVSENQHLQAKK